MTDKKTLLGMLAVCGACLFTSCSDSDGDGGSAPKTPVATFSGKLLAEAGPFQYMYDEYGRCYQINGSRNYEDNYYIDYDKGTIVIEGEEGEEARVSFNGKGYITGLSASWNYTDERGNGERGNGKVTFSYDGDGHVVSEVNSSSGTEIYDGEKISYTGSYNGTYTWKNNNLVKTVVKEVFNEDGDIEIDEDTYTVEYGNEKNITGQITFAISAALNNDTFEPLAIIGMLGKGTANLPSVVSWTSKQTNGDGDIVHTWEGSNGASYTLNSDGTVRSESYGYTTRNYTYVTIDAGSDRTKASVVKAPWQNKGKAKRIKDLFVHRR